MTPLLFQVLYWGGGGGGHFEYTSSTCGLLIVESLMSHLICQKRNALHFLDFASWCKDSAIPSMHISPRDLFPYLCARGQL